MILRVRLEELAIDRFDDVNIPSIPDKLFDLPEDPVPFETIFAGKHLLDHAPSEYVIKWGFKGAVGALQKKLIEDPELDSASSWFEIDSSPSSPFDMFEAFLNGKEVPMKGRAGVIVER
jgi:hypothetical protein